MTRATLGTTGTGSMNPLGSVNVRSVVAASVSDRLEYTRLSRSI